MTPLPDRARALLEECCRVTGADLADVLGHNRTRAEIEARGMFSALAHDRLELSYPEVAAALGRANHSGVVAAAARWRRTASYKALEATAIDAYAARMVEAGVPLEAIAGGGRA